MNRLDEISRVIGNIEAEVRNAVRFDRLDALADAFEPLAVSAVPLRSERRTSATDAERSLSSGTFVDALDLDQ